MKVNQYDEHQTLANQIQQDLITLFRIAHKSSEVCIKSEIKEEDFDTLIDCDGSVAVDQEISDDRTKEEAIETTDVPSRSRLPQNSLHCGNSFDFGGVSYYQCEHCGKTYRSKEGLRIHESMHTKERNHQCDVSSQTSFSHIFRMSSLNRYVELASRRLDVSRIISTFTPKPSGSAICVRRDSNKNIN